MHKRFTSSLAIQSVGQKTFELRVPEGADVWQEPLVFEPQADATLEITLGVHSRATVIEVWTGAISINYHLMVQAGAHSQLRVITLQTLDESADFTETRQTFLSEGATVHLLGAHFGGASVKSTMTQIAQAPHATPLTDLISLTQGKQRMDFTLKNHYESPHGLGEIYAKGVAKDQSQLTINGIIHIGPHAGGTNTTMHEHTLLLSKEATIKATPALEIDTNDVKASHGASVSNLSDEAVFYAASRGIPAEAARRLMARGFLSERLSAIKDLPDWHNHILEYL